MNEQRKSAVEWTAFENQSKPEQGRMPSFSIEWRLGTERSEEIETLARQLLEKAVEYLKELYGDNYPTPDNFLVEITLRNRHGAQGALIKLSQESLAKFEGLDEKEKDQEQSLIIHELVHNLRDEEDLSMLAELIYMLEKGHGWLLSNLAKIRGEGRLSAPYETGLEQIATWLATTVERLLEQKEPKNLVEMREVFRRNVDLIVKKPKVTYNDAI